MPLLLDTLPQKQTASLIFGGVLKTEKTAGTRER